MKSEKQAKNVLPPGVALLREIDAHAAGTVGTAFDGLTETLASSGFDKKVKLWDARTGALLHTFDDHQGLVVCVVFHPDNGTLATGSSDKTVKLWDSRSYKLLRTLEGHEDRVWSVAFDPHSDTLVSGSLDGTVKLWDSASGNLRFTLEVGKRLQSVAVDPNRWFVVAASSRGVTFWDLGSGDLIRSLEHGGVCSVAFAPEGMILASAGYDSTINLWDVQSGKLLRRLEGHLGPIDICAFSSDGRLLASKSHDDTVRLWSCETGEPVAVIHVPTASKIWVPALAFHPKLPLLAAAQSQRGAPNNERSRRIHLWELDYDILLSQQSAARSVHHTTAKIMLLGDHSVGKSALGYRLIHGTFKEQASTHGQRFWVYPTLGKRRADGTECEAILWDFAGQPDYRLVHALFVDNADLALVLFDASNLSDPLRGVGFWLKQLQTGQARCPIILVPAQSDRGSCALTSDELGAFCAKHGIDGPIATSAFTGEGLPKLIEQMKVLIRWDDKAATVTTTTFKRIKDYVLGLKEGKSDVQAIVTLEELRARLLATDQNWKFTDAEMVTAVGHLENTVM